MTTLGYDTLGSGTLGDPSELDVEPDPTEVETPGSGLHLKIINREDWDEVLTAVHTGKGIRWLDQINDPGYGEVTIALDDEHLQGAGGKFNLGPLFQGNVVACYIDGKRRFSWRIEEHEATAISGGDEGEGDPGMTLKGRGVLSVLEHGVVMSEEKARDSAHHIARLAPDERAFTFAADRYDDTGWPTADNAAAFGVRETQTVTITGSPTGGTFTVTFGSDTSDPIAYNATVRQFRLALEDLSTLSPEDFSVGGSTGSWAVSFAAHLGDVDEMTADGSGLTGGTSPDATVSTTTAGEEASAPESWPDDGVDWWVSAPSQSQTDPDDDSNPDVALHYLRKQFTLDDPVRVSVFAACAGECEIFIDGAPVLTAEGTEQTSSTDLRLFGGVHQIAIRYRPDADSDARLVMSIGDRTGNDHGVPVYDWLVRTDDTWKGKSDVWPPPGFTPGRIASHLINETRARATSYGLNTQLAQIRIGSFDEDLDSDGNPWVELVDRYWANGTDYLSLFLEMAESACEVYMSPFGRLKLYAEERGVDRTEGETPVRVQPGDNIVRMSHNRRIGKANHILFRWTGGWSETHRNATVAGMREGFLSLGTADTHTEGRRLARETMKSEASFTEITSIDLIAVDGATPYKDFLVGDTILAPHMMSGVGSGFDPQDDQPRLVAQRVMAIGVQQQDDGSVLYSLALAREEDDE